MFFLFIRVTFERETALAHVCVVFKIKYPPVLWVFVGRWASSLKRCYSVYIQRRHAFTRAVKRFRGFLQSVQVLFKLPPHAMRQSQGKEENVPLDAFSIKIKGGKKFNSV